MITSVRAEIRGHWRIERQDRETGEWLEPYTGLLNAVTTAGKQKALDIMFGLNAPSSSDQLTQTNTDFQIYTAGPSLYKTLNCTTGPTHGAEDSGTVRYEFEHYTADAYSAARWDIYNGATSLTFSQYTTSQSKPSTENWKYVWTLSLSNSLDSDLQMDGLDHALRLITGNRSMTGKQWAASGTNEAEILIDNTGRTIQSDCPVDTGYPSRSGTTVTLVFTSPTNNDSQEWRYVAVQATMTDEGVTKLSETDENAGTKNAAAEWEYTFTFSL